MTDAVHPPIVEARQLYDDLGNHIRICDWINKHGGEVTIPAVEPCLYVKTPTGTVRADIGDWVARDAADGFHVRDSLAPTAAEMVSDRFAGKTCATCGGQATVADGIAGVFLCDGNECLTAAYDKVWQAKATESGE